MSLTGDEVEGQNSEGRSSTMSSTYSISSCSRALGDGGSSNFLTCLNNIQGVLQTSLQLIYRGSSGRSPRLRRAGLALCYSLQCLGMLPQVRVIPQKKQRHIQLLKMYT